MPSPQARRLRPPFPALLLHLASSSESLSQREALSRRGRVSALYVIVSALLILKPTLATAPWRQRHPTQRQAASATVAVTASTVLVTSGRALHADLHSQQQHQLRQFPTPRLPGWLAGHSHRDGVLPVRADGLGFRGPAGPLLAERKGPHRPFSRSAVQLPPKEVSSAASPSAPANPLGIDGRLATTLARYCFNTYFQDHVALARWQCAGCRDPLVQQFKMLQIMTVPCWEIMGYVGHDPVNQLVVVVFRGTYYLQNWVVDFDSNLTAAPGLTPGKLHKGWHAAYFSSGLASAVSSAVSSLLRQLPPSFSVAVTGHSLGGALATLCALDLVVNHNFNSANLQLVTFGSPRVGNEAFVDDFFTRVPNQVRFVHANDIVPHDPPRDLTVPADATYHHLPREIWINGTDGSQWKLCDLTGEDPSCSLQVPRGNCSWIPHLSYLGVSVPFSGSLVRRHGPLWTCLVGIVTRSKVVTVKP